MEQWIEEFLFRGRPASGPGSETEPTFSVTVGFRMVHPVTGEHMPPSFQQVTPEKAAEMGMPLGSLVADINAEAITATDAARGERDEAKQAVEVAKARIAELEAALAALQAKITKMTEPVAE